MWNVVIRIENKQQIQAFWSYFLISLLTWDLTLREFRKTYFRFLYKALGLSSSYKNCQSSNISVKAQINTKHVFKINLSPKMK